MAVPRFNVAQERANESLMAKRYSSVVGIDVGSHTIKVAEIRSQGGRPAITALGIIPTPMNTVDQTGILDPENVGAAVRQACAESGAGIAESILSLAGQQSILVRTLEVPRMNETELRQHMDWEVQRNIPFSESDVEQDFKAYPASDAASQNLDVVMAISPRSAIENAVGVIKKAGKKPVALDVEPLAIARVLSTAYAGDINGQSICVVEIGHRTTAINIYKDGQLMMPRQVPMGGEMFTREISERLGVSMDEAERLKIEQGEIPSGPAAPAYNPFDSGATMAAYNPFAEDAAPAAPEPTEEVAPVPAPSTGGGDMRVYQAMAPALDELVAEIRRSVDYYRGKGGDVDRLFLTGGGSKLRGLAPFLGSAMGLNVQMLESLRGINVQAKTMDGNMAESMQADFSVAVGNALHIFF